MGCTLSAPVLASRVLRSCRPLAVGGGQAARCPVRISAAADASAVPGPVPRPPQRPRQREPAGGEHRRASASMRGGRAVWGGGGGRGAGGEGAPPGPRAGRPAETRRTPPRGTAPAPAGAPSAAAARIAADARARAPSAPSQRGASARARAHSRRGNPASRRRVRACRSPDGRAAAGCGGMTRQAPGLRSCRAAAPTLSPVNFVVTSSRRDAWRSRFVGCCGDTGRSSPGAAERRVGP